MRKKSHISLSHYLLSDLDERVSDLKQRRGSFYVGSILPDITPSFIYRKHNIDSTFGILQKKIERLLSDLERHAEGSIRFWIRLGVVMHYLADYCTYPHNSDYHGSMKEHCHYELELKYALRAYVRGDIPEHFFFTGIPDDSDFAPSQEIFDMITALHAEYQNTAKKLESDCSYIVDMCRNVLNALLQHKYEIAGVN